jgi:hypothetical protein
MKFYREALCLIESTSSYIFLSSLIYSLSCLREWRAGLIASMYYARRLIFCLYGSEKIIFVFFLAAGEQQAASLN